LDLGHEGSFKLPPLVGIEIITKIGVFAFVIITNQTLASLSLSPIIVKHSFEHAMVEIVIPQAANRVVANTVAVIIVFVWDKPAANTTGSFGPVRHSIVNIIPRRSSMDRTAANNGQPKVPQQNKRPGVPCNNVPHVLLVAHDGGLLLVVGH